MLKKFKVIFTVLAVLVMMSGAYAFAAANTIAESAAGYASATVPGYTVGTIIYDLDAADPTIVDAITFNIAPTTGAQPAVTVKVQTTTGGPWTTCVITAIASPNMLATCTYGALTVASVTNLNIVASSTTDPAP